jgi:hypothetical protein
MYESIRERNRKEVEHHQKTRKSHNGRMEIWTNNEGYGKAWINRTDGNAREWIDKMEREGDDAEKNS